MSIYLFMNSLIPNFHHPYCHPSIHPSVCLFAQSCIYQTMLFSTLVFFVTSFNYFDMFTLLLRMWLLILVAKGRCQKKPLNL